MGFKQEAFCTLGWLVWFYIMTTNICYIKQNLVHIYIYIYRERERDGERERQVNKYLTCKQVV